MRYSGPSLNPRAVAEGVNDDRVPEEGIRQCDLPPMPADFYHVDPLMVSVGGFERRGVRIMRSTPVDKVLEYFSKDLIRESSYAVVKSRSSPRRWIDSQKPYQPKRSVHLRPMPIVFGVVASTDLITLRARYLSW